MSTPQKVPFATPYESNWRKHHVMIDIETLSLQPNAVVLQVAACAVFPDDWTCAEFNMHADPKQPHRHIDIDTVKWWMEQEYKCPLHGTWPLSEALYRLAAYVKANFPDPIVWFNGPQFDLCVLEDAVRGTGYRFPWRYNAVRDLRTLWKTLPPRSKVPRDESIKHDALADVRYQSEVLRTICADHNLELK